MMMRGVRVVGRPVLGLQWGSIRDMSTSTSQLPKIDLYQYEVCPFCSKVKASMDYYKIPYTTIEVNPLTKKEVKWSTDYKKVPIAMIDGEKMIESDPIMDRMRSLVEKEKPSEDETKWRKWSNEKLVVTLPPNLYRSLPEAWSSFKYISANNKFSALESLYVRSVGALFMRAMKGRMMKKHGIEDERKTLSALLDTWSKDAVNGKSFQHGDSNPGLADLSVFGMIRSMQGVPTFDFVMSKSNFRDWYERMEKAVGPSTRIAAN